MAGETLHEERAVLGKDLLNRHRAFATIMEELEAADWYDQRIAGSDDAELRAVLTHNRDEEKEHAAMLLEWLRRHDPALDRHLRAQLFRDGAIRETAAIEQAGSPGGGGGGGSDGSGAGSLGIGSLRAGR